MKQNNILQIVQQHLKMRNVAPHIIEDAAILIRRAVVRLQSRQILPPKILEFMSHERKEIKYNVNNEENYTYYKLPGDFRTLEEIFITNEEGNHKKPYSYTSYDNYLSFRQNNENGIFINKGNLFTIADINNEGENPYKIIVASPFPEDTDIIRIEYYPDGIITTSDYFTPRHWEAIIEQIEIILGIISPEQEIQTIEEVSSWKNQKGKNTVNQTSTKTKVTFPFAGKLRARGRRR